VIAALEHIQIYTVDLSRSIEFYEMLGGIVSMTDGLDLYGKLIKMAMISLGNISLELCERAEYAPISRGILQPFGHICFVVDDLDGFVIKLRKKGVYFETDNVIYQSVWGGFRSIFLRGPSDERIELRQV